MKKIKQHGEAYMALLSIIGIIILVNFFSYKIFARLDLTQNKEFSVSSVTKTTLRNLDDVINIKVYFSKNLPSKFISLKENVGDILDAYTNYSSGNVRVEFIDPTDNKDLAKTLYMKGIPELQFQVFEKDQMQLVKGYMGISIEYGSDYEVIPAVQDTKSLEYQITLAIKKLTSGEIRKIGMLSGYGTLDEKSLGDGLSKLKELYDVVDVDIANVEEIDPSLKTFIIIRPEEEVAEEDLKKIDKFVTGGGNLLVLDEGVSIGDGLKATDKNDGLMKLLDDYGIKINNDMVVESKDNSGVASFNQGFFTFQTNYPYWPMISKDRFDQDNSAVSKLENVVLPWASSIDIDESKLGENHSVSYLAKSSIYSWIQSGQYDLNPQQTFTPGKKHSSNLAVDVNAQFKSPYGIEDSVFSRILVVGDSDFVTGNLLGMADNMVFFQNITDSLSLDSDLIEIRSKGITSRPLKTDISDGQKALIRYLNVFGITIIVIAFGLIKYFMRKRSRFVDDL